MPPISPNICREENLTFLLTFNTLKGEMEVTGNPVGGERVAGVTIQERVSLQMKNEKTIKEVAASKHF